MAVFWALMANIWEVLTIYAVYVAFGAWSEHRGVDFGVCGREFRGTGQRAARRHRHIRRADDIGADGDRCTKSRINLPVTIMYRVLNTLIQIPPGYVLYHREGLIVRNLLPNCQAARGKRGMPDDFGTIPLSVSDCVAVINQVFDYALPSLTVRGEVANLRVSRGKWVYFDA